MVCEENLEKIKFGAFRKRVGPRTLWLQSVDYFGTSEHYWVVEKKSKLKKINFHFMQMVLWWACGLFSGMIEMTCHVNHFFDLWQWCNFSGIEALEFSCIYTRILPATADVFPVVANTSTKSVQKQIKIIDDDKEGSKKPLASKSCFV